MIIDTHCHLHREEFGPDRDAVLARARAAGVGALIDPAVDLKSNRAVLETCSRYPEVYGALGIHPQEAAELTDEAFAQISELASAPKVVAIGEIGLDYYRENSPREVQKAAFRRLLGLARAKGLPVIIHCRGTASGVCAREEQVYQDLFSILREAGGPVKGLLHCFSGDARVAAEAVELGLYLSFAGNLTFPKAEDLRAVAKEAPFDRVVLETDAPFLAPQGQRGKRNEPAFLTELVAAWARISDLSPEDVARVTSVNANQLFGIGEPPPRGKIAYAIRNSLYINVTNACTDRCVFCALSTDDFWAGTGSAPIVKGHHLRMSRDPSLEEILAAAGDPGRYEEVVFCGYGEPVIRLAVLIEAARRLRAAGAKRIRLNTNGHANLIHKRSVAPELKGVMDEISVSLNTPNAEQYVELCRPAFGLPTYDSIKAFIRECRDAGIKVVATVVAMPGVDVEACRRVAEQELRVEYRVRTYNDVG